MQTQTKTRHRHRHRHRDRHRHSQHYMFAMYAVFSRVMDIVVYTDTGTDTGTGIIGPLH